MSAMIQARVAHVKRGPRPTIRASAPAATKPQAAHPPPAGPLWKRNTSTRSRWGRNEKPSAAGSSPAPSSASDHGTSSTAAMTTAIADATSIRTPMRKPPTNGAATMIAAAAASRRSGAS